MFVFFLYIFGLLMDAVQATLWVLRTINARPSFIILSINQYNQYNQLHDCCGLCRAVWQSKLTIVL